MGWGMKGLCQGGVGGCRRGDALLDPPPPPGSPCHPAAAESSRAQGHALPGEAHSHLVGVGSIWDLADGLF